MSMLMMKKVVVVLPALIGMMMAADCAQAADAGKAKRFFEEANQLFAEGNEAALSDPAEAKGRYDEAVMRYAFLVEEEGIRNPRLFANLANAHFLNGDVGRAILNYRRSLEFDPRNDEVRASLDYARDQRVDAFVKDEGSRWAEWVLFWHYKLGEGMRTALFAIGFSAIWGLMLWRLFGGATGMRFRRALIAAGIVCVLTGVSLVWEMSGGVDYPEAVITAPEVEARKGDGFIYEPAFSGALHSGTELAVAETRGDWVRGMFPNGDGGWLPVEAVAFVQAP